MIIVDTREPDSTNKALSKLAIPQDEMVIPFCLPAGDIVVALQNLPLPNNVAEFTEWARRLSLSEYQLESVVANPQQAAVELLMSKSVVLERKTPHDFLESISDGRLFDQSRRLVEMCKYPIIIITGFFSEINSKVAIGKDVTNWNWWSVAMAILRVQMAGCAVIQAWEYRLPEVVAHLWRWQLEGPKLVRGKPAAPLVSVSEEIEFLMGFPGLGTEKAKDVLQYTGNLTNALSFLTNPASADLPGRPMGFGKKTIATIREFMCLEDGQVLRADDGEIDEDS